MRALRWTKVVVAIVGVALVWLSSCVRGRFANEGEGADLGGNAEGASGY